MYIRYFVRCTKFPWGQATPTLRYIEEGVSRVLLIRTETLERIAAEYGIEDDEMRKILKECEEDTERFKKEIKDAVMNAVKSIKIDIVK